MMGKKKLQLKQGWRLQGRRDIHDFKRTFLLYLLKVASGRTGLLGSSSSSLGGGGLQRHVSNMLKLNLGFCPDLKPSLLLDYATFGTSLQEG